MDIIGGIDKRVFSLESQGINSFFSTHCLCFEHILNLILNGETLNAKATDLVLDEPKEDLLKGEDKLKRENFLKDRYFENTQTFTNGVQVLDISMENPSQPNVEVEHKTPAKDLKAHHLPIYDNNKGLHFRDDIHNYASLNNNQKVLLEDSMNNIKVLEGVIPRQKENNTTSRPYPILINTDLRQNITNIDLEQRGLPINSSQGYLKDKKTFEFGDYGSQQVSVEAKTDGYEDDIPKKLTVNNSVENLDQNNEQNMDNFTQRAFDPEKFNKNTNLENSVQAKVPSDEEHTVYKSPKNSDFQVKNLMERSAQNDKPDISYSEKGREKIKEYIDAYSSEASNLKFGEELKATQEVRNSKHYTTQEHKVFHVKLEDGDLRIRFVKDSLNISLNLKEDIRLPSIQESYRLIESLSQMGLRVEFFGISGKNLQWEFRQGQEGKKESKFKDIDSSPKDEKKAFSLYL